MNISALNSMSSLRLNRSSIITKNRNNNYINNYKNNPMSFDSVSFQGKAVNLPKTIETAKDLGIEIYNQATTQKEQDPTLIIKQKAPNLKVFPIEDLAGIIDNYENYCAFFRAQIDENYNDYNHEIYIQTKISNDKNKALIESMDIAHEFTHYCQSMEGEEAQVLKEISSNWEYYGLITALCTYTFREFDNEIQANFVEDVFLNAQDLQSLRTYNRFLPNKRKVTKEELLEMNNYKSEKEFQTAMNNAFDKNFVETIRFVYSNSYLFEPLIIEKLDEIIKNNQLEQLSKDMKKYCSYAAKKEKEAYATECEVARGILKTRKPFNLDAFCLYYEMLEDALK